MMFLSLFLCLGATLARSTAVPAPADPCAAIAGKKWASPLEVRTCLFSAPVDPEIKENIIEVLNKTLAFHTSVNYQIQAPKPFETDVHEDLHKDIARISRQKQSSEFELHLDLYRSFRRLNDGHCVVLNRCYDGLYVTYLPTPLVLLTEPDGSQNVYIAPEAFKVASAEFGNEIHFWQDALPGKLRGQLRTLSGAKVLLIDGQDPFVAVNANALITGGYQSFGTRQNSFFSSYYRGPTGWLYAMGNFAQQPHPLTDVVELTIQRTNQSSIDIVTIPYRSRLGSGTETFNDSASYRANNCRATNGTNGYDVYAEPSFAHTTHPVNPITTFQQQPPVNSEDRRHPMNVMLDSLPLTDIDLPEELQPHSSPLNESYSVAQFFMLKDNTTGVLALGSFSAANFTAFQVSLLAGLEGLKELGAEKLIVDVTNNGGGYICAAHWLHRIIIGPSESTEPQAGLDTTTRNGPLAQLIVKQISAGKDPKEYLLYNPTAWRNATHQPFEPGTDWLQPPVNVTVNGHSDAFSQRLGQECQPFDHSPPDEPLFKAHNVVIISNGRCASSCSLFSITMSKWDGVKTVVVGGKKDVPQQYCGVVGGQSTDFSTIDTEIKSSKLKNHTLAPPDLLANVVQGITWRLGFGIDDPTEPEEWQDHPADINFPLAAHIVNKPVAIWEAIAKSVFRKTSVFRVQSN